MQLFVVLGLVPYVLSLNILLSTTDSWATKNVRSLYNDLLQQNHSVILLGPLYQSILSTEASDGISSEPVEDGGDFGHLLPSNQIYYNNLMKLKDMESMSSSSPKGLLKQRQIKALNDKYDESKLFETEKSNSNQYGFDPLDKNCVYVNSNNPINILSGFLNSILPKYFPDFEIDLAIVGPTEGDSEKIVNIVNEMTKYLLVKNIPTISAVSADSNHIYFKNKSLTQPTSIFTRISKFINYKIINTINKLSELDELLPSFHSVQLKFPRYFNSNCKLHSAYRFVDEDRLFKIDFSEFKLVDNTLIHTKTILLDLQKKQEIMEVEDKEIAKTEKVDDDELYFVDKMSNYYQHKMKLLNIDPKVLTQDKYDENIALGNCDIAVKVQYLFDFDDDWKTSINF